MTYSYARFNLYFAPDMCLLDFRPAHMESIDGLSRHPRAKRSKILPITSLFYAFSMMAYLIFQCFIDSVNQTSTSPRLPRRSSRSSIMQAISRFSSIFILASFSYICFVLISYTHSHRYILPAGFVLWKPISKVDSMAAAVTFVRCTGTFIAIQLDLRMPAARAREKEIALWACNRYRILPAACAVPVARILIGVSRGPQ
jgi:hypothetical protein